MLNVFKKYIELKKRELDLKEKEIAANLLIGRKDLGHGNIKFMFNEVLHVVQTGMLTEATEEYRNKQSV